MAGKLAYFDTNVFAYVCELGEQDTFLQLLRSAGIRTVVSDAHLFETMKVRDSTIRNQRLDVLQRLPGRSIRQVGHQQALELVEAVKRTRPEWVRSAPDGRLVREHLARHQRRWRSIKHNRAALELNFALFAALPDTLIDLKNEAKRRQRAAGLRSMTTTEGLRLGGREFAVRGRARSERWRTEAFVLWYDALIAGAPAVRDMSDYARPYLRTERIGGHALAHLLMSEVDARVMRRHVVMGTVMTEQTDAKVNRGDSMDVAHSIFLADVDLFFTADKSFARHLAAAQVASASRAQLVVVDRGGP